MSSTLTPNSPCDPATRTSATPGKKRKPLTLLLVVDNMKQSVLLGMKKRGFGMGKWNGFGGKVEPGETIYEAALRELHEEANIHTSDAVQHGLIEFEFRNETTILQVHVFKTNTWSGNIQESDEMRPEWFHFDEIPFTKMWLDDKYWFPLLLQDKKFVGYFYFQDHDTIVSYNLQETDELPITEA